MLLTLAALMSCAVVTFAQPDKLLDLVDSVPAQEEFLIYDILSKGDLSSDDVLDAFIGFNVPYKFKSLNGRRFVVVVMKESSNHTKYASLSVPGASQVDVYPAEHLSDFLEYLGVGGLKDKSIIALPDDSLFLSEMTILEQGANLTTFKAHLKAMAEQYVKLDNEKKDRGFHVTAMMPTKLWAFGSLPSYTLDRMFLEGDVVLDGPYQTTIVTTPIVNIY